MASLLAYVHRTLVTNPLTDIFKHGPTSMGFWGGARESDICASVSSVPAAFWERERTQCASMIDAQVDAYRVVLVYGAQLLVAYSVVRTALLLGRVYVERRLAAPMVVWCPPPTLETACHSRSRCRTPSCSRRPTSSVAAAR